MGKGELTASLVEQVVMQNPCTRCGECCQNEVCPMGEAVYKTPVTPCPGLKFNSKKSSCELMEMMNAEEFAMMSFKMGIGWGCTNDYKGIA
jgi:hypothetical protein